VKTLRLDGRFLAMDVHQHPSGECRGDVVYVESPTKRTTILVEKYPSLEALIDTIAKDSASLIARARALCPAIGIREDAIREGSTLEKRRSEAEKLRAEIAEAETKVKRLAGQIRNREGRLRRIAADAFNEESEPIDGMTVEVREISLGHKPCERCPIGICVYSDRVISLPGQREPAGPATGDGACLFCGRYA
jgi:hypothetical protein